MSATTHHFNCVRPTHYNSVDIIAMMQPTTKRKRADTVESDIKIPIHTLNTPSFDSSNAVARLPEKNVRTLLLQAAQTNPGIGALIKAETDKLNGAARAKVINFDHLSKTAWNAINVDYANLSGACQYKHAGDVYHTILDCLREIEKNCGPKASFGTKTSGLETCRKIAKTICLSEGDVLCHQVQSSFQWDSTLEELMTKIANSLTGDERHAIMSTEWAGKLGELIAISKRCSLFADLPRVVRVMRGEIPPRISTASFLHIF